MLRGNFPSSSANSSFRQGNRFSAHEVMKPYAAMPPIYFVQVFQLQNFPDYSIIVYHFQPGKSRGDSAAVAITTTDLVSKSVAIESEVCGETFDILIFMCM